MNGDVGTVDNQAQGQNRSLVSGISPHVQLEVPIALPGVTPSIHVRPRHLALRSFTADLIQLSGVVSSNDLFAI
jgi:hypothetical protein